MITKRAWGRVLIDAGVVVAVSPMWPEWRGKSAEALRRHYASARLEQVME